MWSQLWGRAFVAGTNRSVSKVDEKINSGECQAIDPRKGNKQTNSLTTTLLQDEPEKPMLKASNHLKLAYNSRLRQDRNSFPFYCNSFSTTVPNRSCTNSGNIGVQYQATVASGLASLQGLSNPLEHSEWRMDTDFLEHTDLDLLTSLECSIQALDNCNADTLHVNVKNYSECRCKLCLRRSKVINSIVLKAKRLIARAVESLNTSQSTMYNSYRCEKKTYFYLINLAHLLLIITCLRGIL